MPKTWNTERCENQLDRIIGFYSRIDTKASVIFAINVSMTGYLISRTSYLLLQLPSLWIFAVSYVLCLAISLISLYLSTKPNTTAPEESLLFFCHISLCDRTVFKERLSQLTELQLIDDLNNQIWANSDILAKKFKHIDTSYIMTLLSAIPWSASLFVVSLG